MQTRLWKAQPSDPYHVVFQSMHAILLPLPSISECISALRFGHGGSTSFRLQDMLAGIQHAIGLGFHTVDEAAIVVLDTLGKVDVTSVLLTLDGAKVGAEDGNLATTLNREGDVLSRVGEVCSMSELWSL